MQISTSRERSGRRPSKSEMNCYFQWRKSWEKKGAKGSGKNVLKNNKKYNCVFRASKPLPGIKR